MQTWRLLFLPFSLIYLLIVSIRNKCYDWGWFKSYEIKNPSICVGNITVGGTGKSPLVVYLIEQFKDTQQVVVLSRGYGRKTKGLQFANENSTAEDIGDEPLMNWNRFEKQIPVIVAEERKVGVQYIEKNYPNALIILDDAFQHRKVKARFSIVCMTYDRPIFKDFVFPAGNLRESRSGLKRSDLTLITKCPEIIESSNFSTKLGINNNKLFYSRITYKQIPELNSNEFSKILLVTGIAKPEYLNRYLAEKYSVEGLFFPDHHDFSRKDIETIQQKVAIFGKNSLAIVTTEKDWMRLKPFEQELKDFGIPIYIQYMSIAIENESKFIEQIKSYVTRANERSC
ncbi:MAG: tetraacyldisaccharide 4'-kinase [Fluviicola sp.]